ncbi:hypothetical protein BDK51DRAFT_23985 [Blyttiomyces helicus]|uniref:Uncharacterized protein n=1 Tax=Blyttiomyces helicus TaxID=388810 RepID=A0A4P9WKS0_9FUNG|nr:hypothetical protein BDK51DRAFT_23985 [Blyttiomyces helicus]|eukprot:RKO92623.1 hypothetical protein BDK51DRAFT_23985 [Blyttiomyces helicus]
MVDDLSDMYRLVVSSCFLNTRTPYYQDPDPFLKSLMKMADCEFRQMTRTSRDVVLARIRGLPVFRNNS